MILIEIQRIRTDFELDMISKEISTQIQVSEGIIRIRDDFELDLILNGNSIILHDFELDMILN